MHIDGCMKKEKTYEKLGNELDRIIIAEISARLKKRKKSDYEAVSEAIEQKNREIVEAHQAGKIASIVPSLFMAGLRIKENGRLHVTEKESTIGQYEKYIQKKGRLEVLLTASMNAMRDEELVDLIREKTRVFDNKYLLAKEAFELAENAVEIKKKADKHGLVMPRDEEAVIAYMREISPMRTGLQGIESRCIELPYDDYTQEAVRRLRNAVSQASKSIASLDQMVGGFIMGQADAVFKTYKATKAEIRNIDSFVAQKSALERYGNFFAISGDDAHREQIDSLIRIIDATLGSLNREVEKQKAAETQMSEKSGRDILEVYESFLKIKADFAEGKLESRKARKSAAAKLKKYGDTLKANGQRVKARDIDRFLYSTGLAKAETGTSNPAVMRFYKWAFFITLSIASGLAVFLAYHLGLMG